MSLAQQRFKRAVECFFGKGFSTQTIFRFCGTEGSRATWADSNVNILYDVLFTFNPYRAIQNRKGHTLGTHDALEAGTLSFFGLGKIKANDKFFTFIERRFARAEEKRSERHAARPGYCSDLNLRFEGGQGNGPICGGKGVGSVPTQSRDIADLRSRDQVTGFDQCLGVRANQRIQRDAAGGNGGADVEFIPS